jgi:hypothetical protein
MRNDERIMLSCPPDVKANLADRARRLTRAQLGLSEPQIARRQLEIGVASRRLFRRVGGACGKPR